MQHLRPQIEWNSSPNTLRYLPHESRTDPCRGHLLGGCTVCPLKFGHLQRRLHNAALPKAFELIAIRQVHCRNWIFVSWRLPSGFERSKWATGGPLGCYPHVSYPLFFCPNAFCCSPFVSLQKLRAENGKYRVCLRKKGLQANPERFNKLCNFYDYIYRGFSLHLNSIYVPVSIFWFAPRVPTTT